jgi:hypothetical protein
MTFEEEFMHYLYKIYKSFAPKTIQCEYTIKHNIEALKKDNVFYYFIQEKLITEFNLENIPLPNGELIKITRNAIETYDFEHNKFDDSIFNLLIDYLI